MKASLPNKEVARRHNISYDELVSIYKDIFSFIKEKVSALELKDTTEEEFYKQKTSFVVPKLGKLGTSFDRVDYLNKKIKENARDKNEKDKADVHSVSDNG